MQISKINSTNFKGLWEFKKTDEQKSAKRGCPVYFEDAIYHPFKDETPKQIRETIEKEKKTSVYEYWYDEGDPCGPEDITVLNHVVGERLNITSDEYDKMQNMSPVGHPEQKSIFSNCRYYGSNEIPSDV